VRKRADADFERAELSRQIEFGLSGKGAHADAENAFEELDWSDAGYCPEGAQHSIFQLLNHIIYWQDWAAKWVGGKTPPIPKHARGSWPGNVSPANQKEWDRAVEKFLRGLARLKREAREEDLFSKRGDSTRLRMLRTIGSHNSYHIGQVVVLRQMLGKWPPASGGLTW
jgi:uncharacterized damage-inducible protein DinB